MDTLRMCGFREGVANVLADDVSLEKELLDNKLAYCYDGVKKLNWCKKINE